MAFRLNKARLPRVIWCLCGHQEITHWVRNRSCVVPGCDCKGFKSKGKPEYRHIKKAGCEYGHSHNSGLELKICFDLHCLLQAGEIKDYEAEKPIRLLGFSGNCVGTYKIDFFVTNNDGTFEYIEGKGKHLMADPAWRLKWKLLQDMHFNDFKYKFRVIEG